MFDAKQQAETVAALELRHAEVKQQRKEAIVKRLKMREGLNTMDEDIAQMEVDYQTLTLQLETAEKYLADMTADLKREKRKL